MINKMTNKMIQYIDDEFLKYLEEQSKKYRPCASFMSKSIRTTILEGIGEILV
jgi:hypothetical protein